MIVTKIANPRLWLVQVDVTCFHRHFYSILSLDEAPSPSCQIHSLLSLSLSLFVYAHLLVHLHLLLFFPLASLFDHKLGQVDEKSMKLCLKLLASPCFFLAVTWRDLCQFTLHSIDTLDLLQLICLRNRHLYSQRLTVRIKYNWWFTCTRKWCILRTVQHDLHSCKWSVDSTCFFHPLFLGVHFHLTRFPFTWLDSLSLTRSNITAL